MSPFGPAGRGRRTWVKICGHRRPESALAAAQGGADAIGLVFAPSPRRVSQLDARAICAELAPEIERIGVFVDQEPAAVAEIALETGLTAVQLHGCESPETLAETARRLAAGRRTVEVYKAVSVRDRGSLAGLGPFLRPRYLLDAYVPGLPGGSGRSFDWDLALAATAEFPEGRMILAGGLNPGNVAGAIARVRPWGVDVSSGVETGGDKNPELIAAFLRAVREGDLRLTEAAEAKEAAHVAD